MEKFEHHLKSRQSTVQVGGLDLILENNKIWANYMVSEEPDYFEKLVAVQKPKYLWIGCADSRVPANEITGLKPGELFVHRNVANIVSPSDINALAVIQYAVEYLRVEDIIVTGHYGCGGVKASFNKQDYGPLEAWLSLLRDVRASNHHVLMKIDKEDDRCDRLVELNVMTQVLNVARIPVVQKAWKENRPLRIHGLVYSLHDGLLKNMGVSISKITHIPEEHRIID